MLETQVTQYKCMIFLRNVFTNQAVQLLDKTIQVEMVYLGREICKGSQ